MDRFFAPQTRMVHEMASWSYAHSLGATTTLSSLLFQSMDLALEGSFTIRDNGY